MQNFFSGHRNCYAMEKNYAIIYMAMGKQKGGALTDLDTLLPLLGLGYLISTQLSKKESQFGGKRKRRRSTKKRRSHRRRH